MFCTAKETVNGVKKQLIEYEKNIVSYCYDRELISRTHGELKK